MMKDYYQKSINALQLAGMSGRTQECYTRSVRKLADFYDKTPDLISEKELEDYFLHRRNVDQWAPATLRIAYSGIKFFFINVLKQDWHIFKAPRRLMWNFREKKIRKLDRIIRIDRIFLGVPRCNNHINPTCPVEFLPFNRG